MERVKKLVLVFSLLNLISGTFAQDSIFSFTARDAVKFAMSNSAQVRNALIGIDLQKQTNREITSAAYPQVNGTLNVNHYPNIAVQSFPNFIAAGTYGVLVQEGVKNGSGTPIVAPDDYGTIQAQFGTNWNTAAGIDLSQILFDGQVFVGLQARSTAMDFSRKTAAITEVEIMSNVFKVYFQLIAGKQQISTLGANIERIEKLLNDTKEIYKNGFAEKLDVNKAEVTLANLRTQRLKVQNQYDAGVYGLKLLIGMPVKHTIVLTDTLPETLLVSDVIEEQYSYTDRVEYQQLELNKKLNEYNVRRYKLSYIPTVSLSAAYYQNAQRNAFDFLQTGLPWFVSSSIGLRVNVPIFDGFARDARIKTAKLQLKQTENLLSNLQNQIDNEVETARINIRTAIATMADQKSNMELAEQVYQQTVLKFQQGLGSNIEITTAQTELTAAQNNYFSALYDAIVARVDYLRSVGKLQP